MNTQLLCTFCTNETLEETIAQIIKCYSVAFDAIYILDSVNDEGAVCCTYNVFAGADMHEPVPPSTISLHRKKQTNTLYTINALNKLVAEQNGGKIDKNFPVEWNELRNTILVTQYGQLKRIPTRIREIRRLESD